MHKLHINKNCSDEDKYTSTENSGKHCEMKSVVDVTLLCCFFLKIPAAIVWKSVTANAHKYPDSFSIVHAQESRLIKKRLSRFRKGLINV